MKVGDVVWLGSGGPPMTVDEFDTDGIGRKMVSCQWFEGRRLHVGLFSVESVEPHPDFEKEKKEVGE